ncbi:toprim domain-containing protein [Simkania negevensis]|uniref:p4 alpha zinc-binding domain protein n=1 Tax=Simkania negevensis (strain ATCC VR-1471 / DSM 27360 / Z) TaxID=331113 RepID=F8L8J2_SIMNZ|nr:toprim domain-containing protein [Simkania negevensis]CCB89122.1 p4 alpha zinc-binding domain protein [Simkania negevensis Z]
MIIDLMSHLGITPIKASTRSGGIFHSQCPECGGKDRFTIWAGQNRYWCRRCNRKGDEVQFYQDFMGLSWTEAKQKVGLFSDLILKSRTFQKYPSPYYTEPAIAPKLSWKRKMATLIEHTHQRLIDDPIALQGLYKRGLTDATITQNLLGFLGAGCEIKSFESNTIWLPEGYIIPLFGNDGFPFRLKIRKIKDSCTKGKYYYVPGGASNWSGIFGNTNHDIVVLVESEFDAMLIQQEAWEYCCCVALGGCSHRPDMQTYFWLKRKQKILFALDFDEAGKKVYPKWKSGFTKLIPHPVPLGKSPEEAFVKHNIDLKKWISKCSSN